MKVNLGIILVSLIVFILFAGCIEGSFTKTETVLVKLDREDNIQWISVIQNPDYAKATALAPRFYRIIQTPDNGFFVAGYYSNRSGYTTLRVFRTDSNGNALWDHKQEDSGMGGEIRSILQWDDGEYSVIGRDGLARTLDSAGTPVGATNLLDPVCRTNGTVCYDLTSYSLTQNSDGTLTWVLTNGNFSTSRTTLLTATVARNGTLLKNEILPLKNPDGMAGIIRTNDGGWLSAKRYRNDTPGGGTGILVEKTNASSVLSWDIGLGTCNKTAFCNNDLIGMHDSGDGYDIVYQSHLQHSNESVPVDTISVKLDPPGNIVRQDEISNLSELPYWIFSQDAGRTEFYDIIPKDVLDAAANAHGGNNPTFGEISLIRTADGGHALLGTRFYWG